MNANNPVNIVARHEIWPDLIDDFWFTEDPFLARMRERIYPFTGGTFTKSIFRFRPLTTSHYRPGATFTISKPQTLGESVFDMKYIEVPICEYKEELQVVAKGPEAVFSLLDEDMENGLSSLSDAVSVAAWGAGQVDESLPNGFAEMMGHPTLPSWDGVVYPTYGGSDRTAYARGQISGNVYWVGNPDGTKGPIDFVNLDKAFKLGKHGPDSPDLILVNKSGHSYLYNKLEPAYRYTQDVRDPYWGGDGFKFHNAIVVESEHMPSFENGLTDDDNFGNGNYKTAAFTNPVTTALNNFPVVGNAATLDPGEVIFIVNTNRMVMRLSDDPEFAFGFTGFQKAFDSNKVVGFIQAGYNFEGIGSRYHVQVLGMGS